MRQAYRTIADKTCADVVSFDANVRQRLDATEAAARAGRLCVESRLNALTGANGVIVGSNHPDPARAMAIAELLYEPEDQGADFARDRFEWLHWAAANNKLSAVAYAVEPGGSRVAFAAVVTEEGGNLVFDHLARLLVTEAELTQWHQSSLAAIDYTFRPTDYWDAANVRQAVLSTIKGENRRRMAAAALENGTIDRLPEGFTDETISKEDRDALARVDLTFLGGEYLPDAEAGEVEIARIVFASAGQDVISVRAARPESAIYYRVVDEYQRSFRCTPSTSTQPLTLAELVTLIDSCELVDDEDRGLVRFFLDAQVLPKGDAAHQRRTLQHFIRVESEFYPHLREHYEQQIERWVATGRWRDLNAAPDDAGPAE
jgi:hypothetical protein